MLNRRLDAKIRLLAGIGSVIGGSVAAVKIRCGNPNCRCASGERHEATLLCKKVGGKSTSIHVPRDLMEVRTWSNEHKRVKKLLKEISDLSERIIRLHVQTKRAAAKNVARASRDLAGVIRLTMQALFPRFNEWIDRLLPDPRRDHPSKEYPFAETTDDLFKQVDPSGLNNLRKEMVVSLIRAKRLDACRWGRYWRLAVDDTGIHTSKNGTARIV